MRDPLFTLQQNTQDELREALDVFGRRWDAERRHRLWVLASFWISLALAAFALGWLASVIP